MSRPLSKILAETLATLATVASLAKNVGKKVGTVIVATHETTTGVVFSSKLKQYILSSAFAFLNKKKKENPPRCGLTSLKGLGMAESISTLMKESSPSADRLELSAEGACEMTRFTSFFLLVSDSSFFFCRTEAPSEGREGRREGGRIILQIIISNVHLYPLACFNLITGV